MRIILYILTAFIVSSCTFQQPKQETDEKSDYSDYYMYHLEDTIYSEDGEIMMYKTDGKLIWEHVGKRDSVSCR